MNLDSFTDDQLLNLINSTIIDETNHSVDMFTGGSIQITTTHNNKITNYKALLYFGYNEKRNPITYAEEITKDEFFIWSKAIMLKVESLKIDNVGSSFDKLNSRMNKKTENENTKEVIGKGIEVIGIGRGRTSFVRKPNETTKEILDYLNTKASKKFKHTTKSTLTLINARLKDGYTLEDFKTVIDKKVKAWEKDKKMSVFIRPETLFGSKFDGYLNESEAVDTFKIDGKDYDDKGEF